MLFKISVSNLKISMFQNIISSHPVQDELRFVSDPHDVVPHGVRQQPTLVDQLDKCKSSVLLERVLPFLGAEQHH